MLVRPSPLPRLRARRGFTIPEMVLAMSLMLMLIGLSTQLFRRQSTLVSTQNGRLDAQSNSRYALSILDRELRVAGSGVVDAQPMLVLAGPLSLTFNADLTALDTGDLAAVYINPHADSGAVNVMRTANKITLPGTTSQYPDTTYMQASGVPSNAETISYWLSRDSTSTASNEYILFRRVNARPARVVARGILYNAADTIFQYFKGDSSGALTPVSSALLPLRHSSAIHGATADTGRAALVDSIRQVKVQFTSVFHDRRTNKDVYRRMQTTIHLMNAGLIRHTTCGNPPIAVTASAVAVPADTLPAYAAITWHPSLDERSGEKDVERYALYRRLSSETAFDQPFASVPAGDTVYHFQDMNVLTGQTWVYGVTAQDCTPSSSSMAVTASVTIP